MKTLLLSSLFFSASSSRVVGCDFRCCSLVCVVFYGAVVEVCGGAAAVLLLPNATSTLSI